MKVNCECTTCLKNTAEFGNDLMGTCLASEITLVATTDNGDMQCDQYIWDKNKKFRGEKYAK